MEKTLITMPIQVLYINKITLREVLKSTKILNELCFRTRQRIDFQSYYNEMQNVDNIQNFSTTREFLSYVVEKYLSKVKIGNYVDLSNNIQYIKNQMFVGEHVINIDTFMYLNDNLWPNILAFYINLIYQNPNYESFELHLFFKIEDLKRLYNSDEIVYVLNEFCSDLSLYLTYNNIGELLISEDNEPIVSNDEFSAILKLYI